MARRSRAAGRGDGGGHRRRAVADRQRPRLLRGDPGLPGGVRAAPRARVDRRADAVVRAAARHGGLHRSLPDAPGRDHVLHGGGRTRSRRRGAPPSAARRRQPSGGRRSRDTRRARSIACRESWPRPRGLPEGEPLGREPQPGLALLRLARETATPPPPRSAARSTRPREPPRRARLLPAYVEIMLAVGEPRRRARALPRARADRRRSRERECWARWRHTRRGAVDPGRGGRPRGPGRTAARGAAWQQLRRRTRRRASRALIGLACRALGTRTRPRWSWRRPVACSPQLGAAPELARIESLTAPERPTPHGLTARELEVLRLVAAGKTQPGDRRRARGQRAHGRPAPAEHLRQARRVVAHRGRRVRLRARSRLTRRGQN